LPGIELYLQKQQGTPNMQVFYDKDADLSIIKGKKVVDAESGETQVIKAGVHEDALAYELSDMEKAIAGDVSCMYPDYTKDVMDLMTEFRKSWHFTYPEEE
jgi:hypothetical protein